MIDFAHKVEAFNPEAHMETFDPEVHAEVFERFGDRRFHFRPNKWKRQILKRKEVRNELLQQSAYYCTYCGMDFLADLGRFRLITRDHVLPRSKGGADDLGNQVACCVVCNAIKGNNVYPTIDDAREEILEIRQQYLDHLQYLRSAWR
jgi:5-methylcytosine-specific restriction endonuclease McrA